MNSDEAAETPGHPSVAVGDTTNDRLELLKRADELLTRERHYRREAADALIRDLANALRTASTKAGQEPVAYGIIDPDYARIFTIARLLAWSEGYALMMHGSFTRDLDLLAVPWTAAACEPEHLVRRIIDACDLRAIHKDDGEPGPASPHAHGRLVWTLMFKKFADPRFVDFGVMPLTHPADTKAETVLRAAAKVYMGCVHALSEFVPGEKITYFEASPTKNEECCNRWLALNEAGKVLKAAIEASADTKAGLPRAAQASRALFNEDALGEEIAHMWGRFGAHYEVFETMRRAAQAGSEDARDGWISINDRLPKIGTEVLTYSPNDRYCNGPRVRMDEFVTHYEEPYPGGGSIPTEDWFGEDDYQEVTHWMPLPRSARNREGEAMSPDGTPSFWATAPDGTKLHIAKHGENWTVIYPHRLSQPAAVPSAGERKFNAGAHRDKFWREAMCGRTLTNHETDIAKEFFDLGGQAALRAAHQAPQAEPRLHSVGTALKTCTIEHEGQFYFYDLSHSTTQPAEQPQASSSVAAVGAAEQGEPDLKALVDRFLAWPLPASVCADPCATAHGRTGRVGTNLLTAVEAEAMLRHVLATPQPAEQGEPWNPRLHGTGPFSADLDASPQPSPPQAEEK